MRRYLAMKIIPDDGTDTPQSPALLLSQTGSEITALAEMPSDDSMPRAQPTPIAHLRAHKMIVRLYGGGLNAPASDGWL